MDDNQNSSTIKILVDAVSRSLQLISDKISNYQPVLNQIDDNIDKQFTEINKILFDTQSMSKLLDTSIGDFYKRTDLIINNIKDLAAKVDNLSNVNNTLDNLKKDVLTEISNLNSKLDSYKTSIEPVVSLSNWITKPLGIIIFIISLLFASIAVVNGFNSALEFFNQGRTTQQSGSK